MPTGGDEEWGTAGETYATDEHGLAPTSGTDNQQLQGDLQVAVGVFGATVESTELEAWGEAEVGEDDLAAAALATLHKAAAAAPQAPPPADRAAAAMAAGLEATAAAALAGRQARHQWMASAAPTALATAAGGAGASASVGAGARGVVGGGGQQLPPINALDLTIQLEAALAREAAANADVARLNAELTEVRCFVLRDAEDKLGDDMAGWLRGALSVPHCSSVSPCLAQHSCSREACSMRALLVL
jgi:hypothetical protein